MENFYLETSLPEGFNLRLYCGPISLYIYFTGTTLELNCFPGLDPYLSRTHVFLFLGFISSFLLNPQLPLKELMQINFRSHLISENVFILFSHLTDCSTGYSMLCWRKSFSFRTLKALFQCGLICKTADKNSDVNIILTSL